jgi:anti-sigma B factor antagonist
MPVESYPVRWAGETAIITFPPEVDITSADEVRDKLLSVLNQGATTLIVDMSATTFSDSAGVNAIVRAYRRASATGSQMRLVITSPAVRRVYCITEVDRLIPVYASLGDALGAERPGPEAPGDADGEPTDGKPQPTPL